MSKPTTLPHDHEIRMTRARLAVDGLSAGDALGEQFFNPAHRHRLFDEEISIPPGPWLYSDDTEMALGILEVLDRHGAIDQDDLARTFGRRWKIEPRRGYGPGAYRLLSSLAVGGIWQLEAKALFGGMGSFGNGSAMRVAPVGAYFADNYASVVREATKSAEVTHRHPEGIAGGVAIAVAAAFALQNRERLHEGFERRRLFDVVLDHTPAGDTRTGIERAKEIELTTKPRSVAGWLGNGTKVTCPDTVPFCLWAIAAFFTNYKRAVWETICVGGDMDTNAAIVGGVVALATGREGIPAVWLERREELMLSSAWAG
jgi:ADP-ribosylglycohydrolase